MNLELSGKAEWNNSRASGMILHWAELGKNIYINIVDLHENSLFTLCKEP